LTAFLKVLRQKTTVDVGEIKVNFSASTASAYKSGKSPFDKGEVAHGLKYPYLILRIITVDQKKHPVLLLN